MTRQNLRGGCFTDAIEQESLWSAHASSSFHDGDGSRINPYEISSPEEMAYWLVQSEGNLFQGKYIELVADIDMKEYLWTGINNFSGVFNGNMHTISGVTAMVISGGERVGLFRNLIGAVVENFYLKDSTFVTKTQVAAAAVVVNCEQTVTISKVCVENVSMTAYNDSPYLSTFMGYTENSTTISDCIIRDCKFFTSGSGGYLFAFSENATVKDSSIQDTNFYLNSSSTNVYPCTMRGQMSSCVAQIKVFRDSVQNIKQIFGDENDFSNWFYEESVGDGKPLQKAWLWIGEFGSSTSQEVYNRFKALGYTNS